MKTIDEVLDYLKQRKLELIELREECEGFFDEPLRSACEGGLKELKKIKKFINEGN